MDKRYIVNGQRPRCLKCYSGIIVAARVPFDPEKPFDTLECEKCGHMYSRIEIDSHRFVKWVSA